MPDIIKYAAIVFGWIVTIWALVPERRRLKKPLAVIFSSVALLVALIAQRNELIEGRKRQAQIDSTAHTLSDIGATAQRNLSAQNVLVTKQDSLLTDVNATLNTAQRVREESYQIRATTSQIQYPAGIPRGDVVLTLGLDSGETNLLQELLRDSIHGEFMPDTLHSLKAKSELNNLLQFFLPAVFIQGKCGEPRQSEEEKRQRRKNVKEIVGPMYAMLAVGGFYVPTARGVHYIFYPNQSGLQLSYAVVHRALRASALAWTFCQIGKGQP